LKGSVINRYIAREALTVWVAVVVVLFLVLLTNRFVRYLGDAAEGDLPAGMILQLLGCNAVSLLGLMIPASFFLGVILALGRLYRDSEIAAMAACGIGPGGQYRALYLLAVPLALAVAWVTLFASPWAERASERLSAQAETTMLVQGIQPGRFFQPKGIDGMVYVERVGDDGNTMYGVFIKARRHGETVVLQADHARQTVDPDTGERYLVLYDGTRYEGVPGHGAWRILRFQEHGIRIQRPPAVKPDTHRSGMTTAALIQAGGPATSAELQWRFSLPVMLLVLTLIAVPLSRGGPRDARYTRMFGAVLIYMLYSNGLAAAEDWVQNGYVPVWLGMWWVHGAAAAFGLGWLLKQYGWPLRRRQRAVS